MLIKDIMEFVGHDTKIRLVDSRLEYLSEYDHKHEIEDKYLNKQIIKIYVKRNCLYLEIIR